MTVRSRDVAMVVLALVASTLAVWCWQIGVTTSEFAPAVEGAPAFTATHWSGPWIGASAAAVLVAGLAVIDVWRRRR